MGKSPRTKKKNSSSKTTKSNRTTSVREVIESGGNVEISHDPRKFEALDHRPPTKGWLGQVLIVGLFAVAVRFIHFISMSESPVYRVLIGDAWQYDRWAQVIASGQWLGNEIFYQTPLYPYCLGILYSIFGHQVWAVRIAQALASGIACALLARTGSRFFGTRTGWVAGILLAIYPPAIFFDGILQKASLDLVLVCALLWTVSKINTHRNFLNFLGLGFVLGLLILNRENAWVLFPVLTVWLAGLPWVSTLGRKAPLVNTSEEQAEGVRSGSWHMHAKRLVPVAAMWAGLALILVPVGLRNLYVGGEFLLTTSQMGPNFYIGNGAGASGKYVPLRRDRGDARFERTDARVLAEIAEGRALTPREVSQYWMQRSRQDISADPWGWLKLVVWKWFLTWNQLELVDGEGIRVHAVDSPLLRGLMFAINFGVISALAVMGVWLTRWQWRQIWVIYALTLAFALAVALFFVFARYRFPLVPLVILLASAGLVQAVAIWRACHRRERRDLWIGGLLAAATAVFTCWPMPDHHSDETTYFNVATGMADQNLSDEAMEQFERALQIKPDFAPAYINMGSVAMKAKDYERAAEYWEKALTLEPNSDLAHFKLSSLYLELGQLERADQSIRNALSIDPNSLASLYLLARIEIASGDPAAAVETLKRAVAADRQSVESRAELGAAFVACGRAKEAAAEFEKVLESQPNHVLVANNLAWILATGPDGVRDGKRAVFWASKVDQLVVDRKPEFLDTLAAAYAEAGDFERAVQAAQAACDGLISDGNSAMKSQMLERLDAYLEGRPYRSPSDDQP